VDAGHVTYDRSIAFIEDSLSPDAATREAPRRASTRPVVTVVS
jgi:hypothetical protein